MNLSSSKTVVFSVIFRSNIPFLADFLDSLIFQEEKGFDLMLMVDEVPEVESYLLPYRDTFNILIKPCNGSIFNIRKLGFEYLATLNYTSIIFADTDDIFSPDRIKYCLSELETSAIVVNDISPFSNNEVAESKGFWKTRLENHQIISQADIRLSNFVGLGNSAIRGEVLSFSLNWREVAALDWYLFYQLLQKFNGSFLHNGIMKYRQHAANSVGLTKASDQKIKNIIRVKIDHYEKLVKIFPDLVNELEKNLIIQSRIEKDSSFLAHVVKEINLRAIPYFWWEETEYI